MYVISISMLIQGSHGFDIVFWFLFFGVQYVRMKIYHTGVIKDPIAILRDPCNVPSVENFS